jgi:hypothetical protein
MVEEARREAAAAVAAAREKAAQRLVSVQENQNMVTHLLIGYIPYSYIPLHYYTHGEGGLDDIMFMILILICMCNV